MDEPIVSIGPAFRTACAISGAAVSPNMGYYSSPAVTALLTLFNLRLGAWLPNPSHYGWRDSKLKNGWQYLVGEMAGHTESRRSHVYLSDGGHFDNLGVYELLRRRCNFILSCDAGADPQGGCTELAMVIQKALVDFGITIEIDIDSFKVDGVTGLSKKHFAIGSVQYPADPATGKAGFEGTILYLKMSMNGTEPADVVSYKQKHPDFPHHTTLDCRVRSGTEPVFWFGWGDWRRVVCGFGGRL